jgi:hypothetical protein
VKVECLLEHKHIFNKRKRIKKKKKLLVLEGVFVLGAIVFESATEPSEL